MFVKIEAEKIDFYVFMRSAYVMHAELVFKCFQHAEKCMCFESSVCN